MDILKLLDEFYRKNKEKLNINSDLKYENNAFLTKFRKIQNLNQKGITGNSESKIDSLLNDLITKYKSKGYQILDFSIKENLFEIDPLIMTINNFQNFYKNQYKKNDQDNDLKFLEKLKTELTNILNQSTIKNVSGKKKSAIVENNDDINLNKLKNQIKKTQFENEFKKSYFYLKSQKENNKILIEENIEVYSGNFNICFIILIILNLFIFLY